MLEIQVVNRACSPRLFVEHKTSSTVHFIVDTLLQYDSLLARLFTVGLVSTSRYTSRSSSRYSVVVVVAASAAALALALAVVIHLHRRGVALPFVVIALLQALQGAGDLLALLLRENIVVPGDAAEEVGRVSQDDLQRWSDGAD